MGNYVRVKYGVIDADFPDMPVGGWSGTVTEIIEHRRQINYVQVGRANSSEYPTDPPNAM